MRRRGLPQRMRISRHAVLGDKRALVCPVFRYRRCIPRNTGIPDKGISVNLVVAALMGYLGAAK